MDYTVWLSHFIIHPARWGIVSRSHISPKIIIRETAHLAVSIGSRKRPPPRMCGRKTGCVEWQNQAPEDYWGIKSYSPRQYSKGKSSSIAYGTNDTTKLLGHTTWHKNHSSSNTVIILTYPTPLLTPPPSHRPHDTTCTNHPTTTSTSNIWHHHHHIINHPTPPYNPQNTISSMITDIITSISITWQNHHIHHHINRQV